MSGTFFQQISTVARKSPIQTLVRQFICFSLLRLSCQILSMKLSTRAENARNKSTDSWTSSKNLSNCKVNWTRLWKIVTWLEVLVSILPWLAMDLSRIILVLWICSDFVTSTLVVPKQGYARHQFIAGFGIPVTANSDNEAVSMGMVFKAVYKLVRRAILS